MTQLRFLPATFAASAVFLFSSLSSAFAAPEPGCGSGPACGVGFECTVVGASGCASAAPCAAGESCPEPEPCTTTQVMGCTPAHCTADAECASGMVCHTWTEACPVTDCACAPDVPNCGCGTSQCDPKSVSMCTPRYVLPCQVAADCGDGFTCEEQMSGCASAGTNGSGPTPSDPVPPMPVPECSPQPTGVFQCVAKPINCESATQCPAGWSCVADAVATSPACAPGGDCAADPIPQPVPSAVCRPPYYGATDSSDLETTAGSDGQGTSVPGTVTGKDPGTVTPATPEAANGADAASHDSAACQMGHAPASSGVISLLTLLGALFGLKRRRAQR
jgi:hypothetical protein